MHELFANPVVMHDLNGEPVSRLDETRATIDGGGPASQNLVSRPHAAGGLCRLNRRPVRRTPLSRGVFVHQEERA